MHSTTIICLLFINILYGEQLCRVNDDCSTCRTLQPGDQCSKLKTNALLYCDPTTNKIAMQKGFYLECTDSGDQLIAKSCGSARYFDGEMCRSVDGRRRSNTTDSTKIDDHCSNDPKCLAKLQCKYGTALKIGDTMTKCDSDSDCPSSYQCQLDVNMCCPRAQTICALPLKLGNCKQNILRFWYNAITRECEAFDYSGCNGNDNNFRSISDCLLTCGNIQSAPQCPKGEAFKDHYGKFHTCSHTQNKCPENSECYFDGYVWGCCPSKAYTCSRPVEKGVRCENKPSNRFFFDAQTQKCEAFEFNGKY
ncbi:hypothetical protein AB6A40_010534 [Gnathostoma spinigerum]|uniref:BPTI/Kunitz inhibitor domain-containing protein n=1 Tax=Gnathostoma spinigerum TaxID=75299 RepID=A0ABD6EV28_9BILA